MKGLSKFTIDKFIVSSHLVPSSHSIRSYLRSVMLALSVAHCSDNCLFSGGAWLLQLSGVGVVALLDGQLPTLFLTILSSSAPVAAPVWAEMVLVSVNPGRRPALLLISVSIGRKVASFFGVALTFNSQLVYVTFIHFIDL